MKKPRFSETQILTVRKQAEAGQTMAEVSRAHGISESTFYDWKL